METRVVVLGGGSWGTALSVLLTKKGIKTDLWVRSDEQAKIMAENRMNKRYLPDIELPEELSIGSDLVTKIDQSNIVVLAVPTHSIRALLEQLKGAVKSDQIIVNVAKGIENTTKKRISEIVYEYFPENQFVVLSGPSHAEEVALEIPTTVVSASKSKNVAEYIQDVFSCPTFRIYTNPDVIGVELGGALKNIIALGAGISDGLGYGDNTKAALMTRGIYEMSKLGVELGADADTFSGLSGIGDLIVTCTSMHSRNRRAGILIGKGYSMEDAADEIGMVVEGIKTTKSTIELAGDIGIDMPITREIYNVLYNGADVRDSVGKLMGRSMKHEMEIVAANKKISW
ncbi:MAG: NAD(P)H-dependent glycerol-3-phosphate dehydrogenase [Bacillota bacterium]